MNQEYKSDLDDILSAEVEQNLQKELNVSIKEFRALKKKFKKLQKRDDKVFMDMLRTTSRNHYQMNQMVDRKSRNMIYLNTVMLSLIIGVLISSLSFNKVYDIPLIIFSAFSLASTILA
ncbi:MAG: hypothetical protein HKN76_21770, partial [Saprospiraceae bacterium]|nr:hypothetical protein [Saprospiraceae bacterium]